MEIREIEDRLKQVVTRSAGWLPKDDVEYMLKLLRVGEPGVALEHLWTQLEEYEVAVPNEVASELRALASAMGLKTPRWIEMIGHS
jgi:hypothetical protein